MKPYNTACQFLTIKPHLALSVQQWEGRQKDLGIESLRATSMQRQDVLTHCCDIKL